MKIRVTMDEELDLADILDDEGCTDMSSFLKDELARQVKDIIRDEVSKIMERHTRKWIEKEFGKKGKLQERDGVIYIPLMLKGESFE